MSSQEYKQAIVLNDKIEISTGKKISQGCHASLSSYKEAEEETRERWEEQGAKKVVLKSGDLQELSARAGELDIPYYLVKDAGLTEIEPGTVTALGVGPAEEKLIDKVTGQLELVE